MVLARDTRLDRRVVIKLLPPSVTAMVVTGYILCGAAGMVVGGFLVGFGARWAGRLRSGCGDPSWSIGLLRSSSSCTGA